MSLEKCIQCNGKKVTMGMGGITKKCGACLGVGWVDAETSEASTPNQSNHDQINNDTVPKKRGRKKKIL